VTYTAQTSSLTASSLPQPPPPKKTAAPKDDRRISYGEGGTPQVVYPGVHLRYGFFMTDRWGNGVMKIAIRDASQAPPIQVTVAPVPRN